MLHSWPTAGRDAADGGEVVKFYAMYRRSLKLIASFSSPDRMVRLGIKRAARELYLSGIMSIGDAVRCAEMAARIEMR